MCNATVAFTTIRPSDVVAQDGTRILTVRNWTVSLVAEPMIIYTSTGARIATFPLAAPQNSMFGITKLMERNSYLILGSMTTAKMIRRVRL